MTASESRARVYLAAALLMVALLAAQGVARASEARIERVETGRVLGRTGFAFLTGVRTLGAAVLWNRLDPILHDYYEGVPFDEQTYVLPTLRMVTLLDPQFMEAYRISSFMISSGGDPEEGIAIAREGLRNNPRSGPLYANLVQILLIQDSKANRSEILELSKQGLDPEVQWRDANDLFEGLAVFRSAFSMSGDEQTVERIEQALKQLKESGQIADDHDHDGDGVQDH